MNTVASGNLTDNNALLHPITLYSVPQDAERTSCKLFKFDTSPSSV